MDLWAIIGIRRKNSYGIIHKKLILKDEHDLLTQVHEH